MATLKDFQDLVAIAPADMQRVMPTALFLKGNGDNNFYAVEIDPATGESPTFGGSGGGAGEITSGGINVGKTADNVTPILAAVGGANLATRSSLTVYNNAGAGTDIIYWGYDNTVSATTGTPVPAQTGVAWSIADTQSVYLISSAASTNVRISEAI